MSEPTKDKSMAAFWDIWTDEGLPPYVNSKLAVVQTYLDSLASRLAEAEKELDEMRKREKTANILLGLAISIMDKRKIFDTDQAIYWKSDTESFLASQQKEGK